MANPKNKNTNPKSTKKINWETIKTVTIAILATGIIAFIAGAWTMHQFNGKLAQAVEQAQQAQQPAEKTAAAAPLK